MILLFPPIFVVATLASMVQLASIANPQASDTGALFYFIGWGIFAVVLGFVITPFFFTRLIVELKQAALANPVSANGRPSKLRIFADRMVMLRFIATVGGGGQAIPLFVFAGAYDIRIQYTSYQIPISFICNAMIIAIALLAMNNFSRKRDNNSSPASPKQSSGRNKATTSSRSNTNSMVPGVVVAPHNPSGC